MNEDIINLNDILLNNYYLNTKNILADVCYNLQFLNNTHQKLYNFTNDFSNIIYSSIDNINSIFLKAYSFDYDLCFVIMLLSLFITMFSSFLPIKTMFDNRIPKLLEN